MSVYGRRNVLVNRRGEDIARAGKAMKLNPRSGSVIESESTPLVDERSGEYNAYSQQDLMEMQQGLIHQIKTGSITPERPTTRLASTDEGQELIRTALAHKNPSEPGGPWQVLGEVFTDEIMETSGRMGFTDTVLAQQEVPEGGIARVRVRRKDVVSWAITGDGTVAESFIKQPWIFPKGFNLEANIIMHQAEIQEAGAQLLDEKYEDGLESIMVREDKYLKYLLDQAAVAPNDVLVFGAFTPTAFTKLRRQVWEYGVPVPHMIISIDLLDDIFSNADWQSWYSPIEKHELFENGRLAKIGDVLLITDGIRYPTLRVLNQGEVYFLGAPSFLGVKSVLVPMQSTVVDKTVVGRASRGWFLYQREALTLAVSYSVSKGVKG